MGQRLDVAGRDSQHRIEEPGELDSLRLGGELELGGVSVERTRTVLDQLDRRYGLAVEDPFVESPVRLAENYLNRIEAMHRCLNDLHHLARDHAQQTVV